MEGQKVHEYTVETGTNGLPVARIGRVHNLVTFVREGSTKIHYLDGRWVDDGKNPIDEATVPDEYKVAVSAIPFRPTHGADTQVIINCEFCPDQLASGDYPRHLADKHIRPGLKVQASAMPAPGDGIGTEGTRLLPEQLPPGNYVTDDDGYVVLNADGTPRKRAGRPKKDEAESAE